MEIIEQDLTKYSTIRTKSNAKYFCIINNLDDLETTFKFKSDNNLKYVVLGNGSNLLFSKDRYDDMIFIKLSGDFNFFKIEDSTVDIGAAYSLKLAGRELIKNGYKDYIFFNLIPASIGGAVAQNAGTGPSEEIRDVCLSVKLYDIKNKNIFECSNKDFRFDYRNSIVKTKPGRYVILSAKFDLTNKTSEVKSLLNNMKERISEKINREPSGYSFGSTFMNSKISAWKIVNKIKVNLKNDIGAFYSEKHSNWILNKTAKGGDIAALIKETQNLAKKDLNINLRNEVRII